MAKKTNAKTAGESEPQTNLEPRPGGAPGPFDDVTATDAVLAAASGGADSPAAEANPQSAILNSQSAIARGQQGDAARPACARHNVLMRAAWSTPEATHYKCPVEGCGEQAKRARPALAALAAPQFCPQRTCQGEDGAPAVALVHEPKLSTLAQLHMACPACGFHLKVPRPQFQPRLVRDRHRAATESIER